MAGDVRYEDEGPVEPRRGLDREARMARAAREDGRPPVERALERCDEMATRVLEHAENLSHRLAAVLGPERPEPAMGTVRAEEDYAPLTGRLEGLADRLEEAAALIGRTTRRIEL
jgi:hypothetical protein